MRAYRLVDLYTKSFMACEDPYRSSLAAPRRTSSASAPRSAPHRRILVRTYSMSETGCASRISDPFWIRGREPSGNLANTDVRAACIRGEHSTLHAALTLHSPSKPLHFFRSDRPLTSIAFARRSSTRNRPGYDVRPIVEF